MSHRNYNVDRLRILAAFGIVWFHTQGIVGRHLAYSGLAVFVMLSFAYLTIRSTTSPWSDILMNRFKRFLVPWLFWCVVYMVAEFAKSLVLNTALAEHIEWRWIVIGPSIHLWYLPFAFVMTAVAVGLNKRMADWQLSLRIITGFVLTALAFVLSSHILSRYTSVVPWGQWGWGLPAVFVGVTLGLITQLETRKKCVKASVVLAMFVLGVCCFKRPQYLGIALPYTIAVVLTVVCLLWPGHNRLARGSQWLVSLTLGIYLVHPMVGSLIRYIVWFDIPLMAMPPAVFALSALLTHTMKKTPLRAVV